MDALFVVENMIFEVDRCPNAPKTLKRHEYLLKKFAMCNDTRISVRYKTESFLLELDSISNDLSKDASKIPDTEYKKQWLIQIAVTLENDEIWALRS